MQISEQIIESVLEQLYDTNENKATEIMEMMSKEQPVALSYIMQMSEEFEHGAERETLLFLAVLVWKSYKTAFNSVPEISEDAMKTAEDNLYNKMSSMEEDFDQNKRLEEEAQPILMSFIASEIFADKTEELSPSEHKTVAIHLTSLQVLSDALNEAVKSFV